MRLVLDLQACQTSGSRNRGIGRYSMSLSLAMARQARGHEIVIALNDRFPETIDPICKAFDGLVHKDNIRVFNTFGSLSELDPANIWRTRAAERIRESYIADLSPDIVHVSSLFEGLGDDAVTSTGNPGGSFDTAVTLYDLIPLLNRETYLTNPLVRDWYYRKLLALKNADLLLSISEHSRREAIAALQLSDDRVTNISSAVDTIFRPRVLSIEEAASLKGRYGFSKPFLMYTGGIDYRKNIEGLIEAYARMPGDVRAQYQLAVICSIGDHDRHRLELLASSFGLERNDVVFTGFVPEEDLVALYNACTLFVFPSLHEGFGLPVLEAMRCGAAVIGSNTSSIPEVLGREDALFDPRDVAALAAKMHAVLTDDSFRSELQRHGPQQAKQFSWEASAQRAWDAFEHQHARRQERDRVAVPARRTRPRMAYLSPLPPEKSGIADYSAELLPELAQHYDIEVVVTQGEISDPWIAANFPARTVEWFDAHAAHYDRILYHFGNAGFHQHMFGLLARHPGVVVLHDFFMSGALHYADRMGFMPGAFSHALYDSHGYQALSEYRKIGRDEAIWKFPCNKWVLENALGIIVHSRFSMRLAENWYGAGSAADWKLIPHLRVLPERVDRVAARQKLKLSEDDYLVCSFGLLGPTKLNERMIEAWTNSPLAQDKRCHLVFVGENHAGGYGQELLRMIEASGCQDRIAITGFASQELYRTYLAASDAAVQLRTKSRGETSGTVLDCMAYGIPTIINMHGSSADLPDDVLVKLPDDFPVADLGDALTALRNNPEIRRSLAKRTVECIHSTHHPAQIGNMYRDTIEQLSIDSAGARRQRLIGSIAAISVPVQPSAQDLAVAAACISTNRPARTTRQLLLDISSLVRPGVGNADQRLVRQLLTILLNEQVTGYRVEPAYVSDGHIKYARGFTLGLIGGSDALMEDEPIEAGNGDVFLGLNTDVSDDVSRRLFADLRHRGVTTHFISLDPLLPDTFLQGEEAALAAWLNSFVNSGDPACVFSCPRGLSDRLPADANHSMAGKQAGLKDTDVMICVLCTPISRETHERLLDAWLKSPLATDERLQLEFVGECSRSLADSIAKASDKKRIHGTGNLPPEARRAILRAADAAVLLQPDESAPSLILDCLSNGVPVIVGTGNDAMKSLGKALLRLDNELPEAESYQHPSPVTEATPSRVVGLYRDYLEQVVSRRLDRTRDDNAAMPSGMTISAIDDGPSAQMLVDVTFLARHNLNSGIQRVVHHVLMELLTAPPKGYRVEPVYDAGGYYAYARRFASRISGTAEREDEPIKIRAGDMFLGLDLSPDSVHNNLHVFHDFRNHGVQVFFVVYDLLPVLRPEVFPASAQAKFVEWLETVVTISDGVVGISRTVADEIGDWVSARQPVRTQSLRIGYFHLGAEIATAEDIGNTHQSPHVRPCILMVGTVEPRKGHAQALAAFERLWAQGVDVDLVIAGRQGWMVESLVTRLRTHPEHGKRLFWFEGASDNTLTRLYETSSALLLASEGEGFGLPLIEAARHKLPIIARDLPVFREVAGDHAFYFGGTSDSALHEALARWLSLYSENRVPSSDGIRWLTWAESARQLLDAVIGQRWYQMLQNDVSEPNEREPAAVA